MISVSPRAQSSAIRDLEMHGYIEKETRHRDNGSFTSNLYRVK